jgi:hypothetical protein
MFWLVDNGVPAVPGKPFIPAPVLAAHEYNITGVPFNTTSSTAHQAVLLLMKFEIAELKLNLIITEARLLYAERLRLTAVNAVEPPWFVV